MIDCKTDIRDITVKQIKINIFYRYLEIIIMIICKLKIFLFKLIIERANNINDKRFHEFSQI